MSIILKLEVTSVIIGAFQDQFKDLVIYVEFIQRNAIYI